MKFQVADIAAANLILMS